jgi:hypothetical protein
MVELVGLDKLDHRGDGPDQQEADPAGRSTG